MGLIGSAVPIVRCRHHDPMLNLAFNGTIYESPSQWETIFTNRIRAAQLSVNAIFGGEAAEREMPTPVVSTQRDPHPANRSIDLSRFYNSTLEESWQGRPGDDLASFPKGVQSLGGVEFDVRGIVQLQGKSPGLKKFPPEVKGIPVNHKCQHLYFLHAASLAGAAEDGEQIGAYVIHLSSNQMTLEIPIYYGRTVRDWHQEQNEAVMDKELKVAWTGENSASKNAGKRIRLFVTAWNLAPGVEIAAVDFVSAGRAAAPFLLAMSFD
jgi:hypothetical protein